MRPVSWWWHTAEKSCIVAKIMRVVNGNDASAAVFAEKTSRPQICSSCSLFRNVSDEGVTRGYPLLHVSINPGAPGTPLGHQVGEQPNRRIRRIISDVSYIRRIRRQDQNNYSDTEMRALSTWDSFWATGGRTTSIHTCGVMAKCPSGSFQLQLLTVFRASLLVGES